ncbi:magnesium transporter [Candidatus Bathyarchaeota archaeon]|nr:magnesium transporter [Candidatus Bathyarchaeota archaeon]
MSSIKLNFNAAVKQSLIAYTFNIVGIVAGTLIAYYSGLFEKAPWAVVIYPPILSARGVIGGLFCGRLSTALHLGTIKPRFFGNTRSFQMLFQAIVVITFEASIMMSLIAALFRGIYQGIYVGDVLNLINVFMATMTLALIVISPLTLTVSFLSFKHGLDPDIILYPVESTVADLLITCIYVSVLNLHIAHSFSWLVLAMPSLALLTITIFLLMRGMRKPEFIQTLKESFLTLVLVSFIVNIAGATLGKVDELIRGKQELYGNYPVYVVYPALIDTIGDVGATVGSTATTKLALGTLKPSFSSIKHHSTEIYGAWTASLIMYFIYAVLALIIQGSLQPVNLLKFTILLFTANVLAAALIIIISYSVAILTYHRGLDPDNFEIPIESSLADSITTISLLASLILWAGILAV